MMSFRKIAGVALVGALLSAGASAAQTTEVTLGEATPSIGALPLQIAIDKGLFEKSGVTVKTVLFQGGAPAIQALVGGSAVGCLCAGDHIVNLTSKGFPAEAIVGLKDRHGYALMAGPDSTATDLASLKGKKIGITAAGSQTDNTVRWALGDLKMNPDTDVQIINVGTGGPMQSAVTAGAVDAGMFVSPFIEQNQSNGWKMIEDFRKYHYPSFVIISTKKWVDENKDTARAIAQGVVEGEKMMLADHDLAMATAKEMFPNMSDDVLKQTVEGYLADQVPDGGIPDKEGYDLMVKIVRVSDPSLTAVPYDEGVDTELLKP